MASKSQSALIVAAAAVGIAAIFGIGATEGWFSWPAPAPTPAPAPVAHEAPTVPGIAPVESLSPGESIVSAETSKVPLPPPPPPAEAPKPAPKAPVYAQAPKARAERRHACPHCGVVSSTTWHEREGYFGRQFEVRVRFDDGSRRIFVFPTDPALNTGDRVVLSQGRLTRER